MRVALGVLLVLVLGGCDPSALFNNSADAAPCDSGGPTLGDQCQQVYTTFCQQTTRCGISTDMASCVSSAASHCPCAAENCDAGSCTTADLVSSCQADLGNLDCNAITNFPAPAYWPMSCQAFMGSM